MNHTSGNLKIWSAEFLGTFWLTFGGCGSAVLAAAFPDLGIGLLGVSLAFGLTVGLGGWRSACASRSSTWSRSR